MTGRFSTAIATPIAITIAAVWLTMGHTTAGVLEIASSGERLERARIRSGLFEPGPRIPLAREDATNVPFVRDEDARVTRARPSREIAELIEATAARHAAHPGLRASDLSLVQWARLFQANVEIESGYRPGALSRAGAIGLGQLMPETAALLGVDPHDPAQNLDGSARYLLAMLDRFGSPELALAAYNAGPEAVERHGGIPPYAETRDHVRKVMAVYARLHQFQTSERNPE